MHCISGVGESRIGMKKVHHGSVLGVFPRLPDHVIAERSQNAAEEHAHQAGQRGGRGGGRRKRTERIKRSVQKPALTPTPQSPGLSAQREEGHMTHPARL